MYDVERFRSFLFNSTNHSWYRYILSLFFSNNNLIISTEGNQISIEFRARLNLSFLIPCPKFSKHFRRATLVSMYREKSINTSRRKLKERPNSTVILLCITLTSQFKTRIVAGHVYILEWQSYAGIIRVTFQRAPNTITQLPEINFYRAAPHNESVVAHALSESWCETAVAKLKGKPRTSLLFLRHAAWLSISFVVSFACYQTQDHAALDKSSSLKFLPRNGHNYQFLLRVWLGISRSRSQAQIVECL